MLNGILSSLPSAKSGITKFNKGLLRNSKPEFGMEIFRCSAPSELQCNPLFYKCFATLWLRTLVQRTLICVEISDKIN